VQQVALAGLALVLVWPAARGSSAWLGWLPMWLVGMPLVAWWALLRFPLPRLSWLRLARRTGGQARRPPGAAVAAALGGHGLTFDTGRRQRSVLAFHGL
jgi:hypothetical protein